MKKKICKEKKKQKTTKNMNLTINNKGITLIALVITIIVLLILAGVTISLTLGENGIFRTAEMAGRNYTQAQEQEIAGLAEFPENYGKKVVGYSSKSESGYTGDWRLFYQDAEYTYIIMDGVTGSYKPSDYYTTVQKEDGTLKYQTGADVSEVGQNLSSMLKTNGTFFVEDNDNENIRTTAWLTDTEYWEDYTDEEGNALFAIASPTVELYVASFNATAPSNGVEEFKLEVFSLGYDTTPSKLSISYNNGIYNYSESSNWWISSPSSDLYSTDELYIDGQYSSNYILYNSVTGYYCAVRPIVCIPTSTFQETYSLQ